MGNYGKFQKEDVKMYYRIWACVKCSEGKKKEIGLCS